MRYFKTTFLWIIVLTAIGGYSFFDFEQTRLEEERKDKETRLFPFDPIEILRITLKKEGSQIALERWDTGWKIVEPIEAKAEDEAVEKFLGYVTDSRNDAEYVMDPEPTDKRLKEFGLNKPTVSVTLQTGSDLKSYTLLFGDRAASMGVAFARLKGAKPVYRVLASARSEANKDVYYFRDKTVLRLNPVTVDQLAITRDELSLRLKLPASGASKWEIEKPVKAVADNARVFELVGTFVNAKVKEFIAETKDDPSQYGLDKPKAVLHFWTAGAPEPAVTLTVGNRSPEKRGYYCAMSDRNNVFLLEEDTVHAIPRQTKDLRSRELFFFDKDNLKRFEIHQGEKAHVFVKDVAKEWRKNNASGEMVSILIINEFLNELVSYKIEDFDSSSPPTDKKFGLDPPSVKLLVWPEGSVAPVYLNIGKKTPRGYVFAISGSDNVVMELDGKIERLLTSHFD